MPRRTFTDKKRVTRSSRYEFNEQEKKEIALNLANRQIDLKLGEEKKRAEMSRHKQDIDKIKLDIEIYSRHYRDGYEMKDYECNVIYDYKTKTRIYKDCETGKEVDREPFRQGDEQKRFA